MIIKRKITTLTTDANGRATYRYNSAGIGDINFGAGFKENDGSLLTEIYVEDCKYYNEGDHIDGLLNLSNATMTTDGSAITISTSTSGQKNVYYPTGFFEADEDSSLEVEWITGATNAQRWSSAMFNEENKDIVWFYLPSDNKYTTYINSDYHTNVTCQTGDKIRIEKTGNTVSFYVNDVLLRQETHSTYKYIWGTYTNQNRSQTFKNIKIKPL